MGAISHDSRPVAFPKQISNSDQRALGGRVCVLWGPLFVERRVAGKGKRCGKFSLHALIILPFLARFFHFLAASNCLLFFGGSSFDGAKLFWGWSGASACCVHVPADLKNNSGALLICGLWFEARMACGLRNQSVFLARTRTDALWARDNERNNTAVRSTKNVFC